ncbi:MAG: hypothetical protein V3U57_07470 [Robiginitomaculum sp.]
MVGQYLAAIIMFFLTISFTAMFFLPPLKIKLRSALVNFYWVGVWLFLGGITAMAGSQAVLNIMGLNINTISNAVIFGISTSFVLFVMFAWGRLTLKGLAMVSGKKNKIEN